MWHARAAKLELVLERPATLNVDGELVDAGPRISMHTDARAFQLVVPDQAGTDSPS